MATDPSTLATPPSVFLPPPQSPLTPQIDLALHVQLKNNLLDDNRYNDVVTGIITRVSSLPNYQNYRNCCETLLFACNLAENLVLSTDTIDKAQVVMDALQQLFNFTEIEAGVIKANIQFLYNHNRIKKFSRVFFYLNKVLIYFGIKSA